MLHQLIYALVLHGAYGYDGYAKHALHLIDAERTAVALHFVHHVKGEHHGYVQLHELHGQV